MFAGFRFMTLAAVLGFSTNPAFAEGKWVLVEEKDGIKVYSKEVPGSDLVAFKGVKLMSVPVAKVAQVIMEDSVETKKKWVDMIMDFKVISKTQSESVAYSAYNLPWPVDDRDYIIHSKLVIDNEANQVTVAMRSTTSDKAPPTIGVRAELTHSSFTLVPKPGRKTEVTVEIQTDPKGSLPKWVVNLIQRGWPSNTLKRLEIQAQKPETIENPYIKAQFKGANELAQR